MARAASTASDLSANQQAILRFADRYIKENGFAPTLREIADGAGLSCTSTHYNLTRLTEWGYIKRTPRSIRSLCIAIDLNSPIKAIKLREFRKLSTRQQKILQFISDFIGRNQFAPTLEEIRLGASISAKSVVSANLDKLDALGYVTRGENRQRRALRILVALPQPARK